MLIPVIVIMSWTVLVGIDKDRREAEAQAPPAQSEPRDPQTEQCPPLVVEPESK